jgi:hypothetical protein
MQNSNAQVLSIMGVAIIFYILSKKIPSLASDIVNGHISAGQSVGSQLANLAAQTSQIMLSVAHPAVGAAMLGGAMAKDFSQRSSSSSSRGGSATGFYQKLESGAGTLGATARAAWQDTKDGAKWQALWGWH